ncbi:MAG: gamma-glutamyltransferase, partial [Alphaproteobacteria bacterium]|nr:gamma-glutamyltransferase [Alphaproteobacteria bacterium]
MLRPTKRSDRWRRTRRAVGLALLAAAVGGCAETASSLRPLPLRHAIAAANPHAAEAGRAMLREGGTAVDAAIAAQMVLTLVEPQSSGIGGGAFLVHHRAADRSTVVYDGRETAPSAARPSQFLAADGSPLDHAAASWGGRAVGVPGVVAMLAEAHR